MLEKLLKVIYTKIQKVYLWVTEQCIYVYLKLPKDLKKLFHHRSILPMCGKKTVKGETMTVVWHIDDQKVSHKDLFEVTNFTNTCHQHRMIHEYLGMYLDY